VTKLPFYIVDVFAEQKYAGNQLAVFRDATGLSTDEMQALAREMHYSETTFILSDAPVDGGFDVRIFTPAAEVPFAGHPTLGTAYVIRHEIEAALDVARLADRVVLNLKVGQVPVTFNPDGYSWMRQVQPAFGPVHEAGAIAPILGLPVDALEETLPVQEVWTGLPFFIVPLKRLADLKAARVNRERHDAYIERTAAKGFFLFCPQANEPGHNLAARCFVDYYGVPEDPATGSANGCLAAYLSKHRYFGSPTVDVAVEQGYEIGRPSLLLLRAAEADGGISVQVGGRCLIVARGEFT
jgi:trans-2,3-dihydro-3-hydroxyanthranilate isomerase